MKVNEIIIEINRLPVADRLYVVEKTIQSIRKEKNKTSMYLAADTLLDDYTFDTELTVFSSINF